MLTTLKCMMKQVSWSLQLILMFSLLRINVISGLYFPQSDLTLRLPHNSEEAGLYNENLMILNLRVLTNDSSVVKHPKYQIVSDIDKSVQLDSWTGQIKLRSLPEKGTTKRIVVQAKELDGTATIEINLQSIDNERANINCADLLEDLCFWKVSKYKIYENQPETMLGNIGPNVYRTLCPDYQITHYELLNGTDYFNVMNGHLYANAMLDRDLQYPGPHVDARVKCIIYEDKTGRQFIHERNLNIDVLDVDDNPPILQTKNNITIHLKDFSAGDRLDDNELMVKDVDSMESNIYNVQILDDIHDALEITFSTMAVEHPNITDPPSTIIFARIYSKKTLLPISPYRVILQVIDVTLLPGKGEKSVNISLLFVGPQHHSTSTTTFLPVMKSVAFNNSLSIPRSASMLFRVAQPDITPQAGLIFSLRNSKIFGITPTEGIIYIANSSILRIAPDKIPLTIQWTASKQKKTSTTYMTIKLVNTSKQLRNLTCSDQSLFEHTCANVVTKTACESRCGVGSGTFSKIYHTPGCSWRTDNTAPKGPTSRYETCSPNLLHCPDFICDELEQLDSRICPQDCTTMEPSFGHLNKNKIGLNDGFEICRCDEEAYCSCGPISLHDETSSGNINVSRIKDARDAKARKEGQQKMDIGSVVSNAHKVPSGSNTKCGTSCIIIIICTSFGVMAFIGVAVAWRYRYISTPRRECKHRSGDMIIDPGSFPLDHLNCNNRNHIGQETFTSMNRNLLLPKPSPPDPKWEFPRSRLTIEQVLGEGEFGRVLRAKAIDICDWPGSMTVAVKTLKEDASASELGDLLSEYQLLKEAHHPNVIRLLGACTSPGEPIYLIIEFAEFGSLRNYLRRSRHLESEGRVPCSTLLLSASPGAVKEETQDAFSNYTITPHDILSFAWQISKGMAYLADIKLVHRDLAARNVLLATGKVCKISDFGLTRDIYEDDAYLKRSKGRVPVKWMAPESLADHVYTSKSDVWSFGVLLWELVTLGASPYPGVDVHNLYNLLKAGYRMERPANCSAQLYKLMVLCWQDEASMRPSFKELICQWERMLEDGIEYLNLNPRAVHNQAYFTSLHTLGRASTSSNEAENHIGNFPTMNSVNHLNKLSRETKEKCDKIEKLETVWQHPLCSSSNEILKTNYVNENRENMNVNHYESPIRPRKVSIDSNVHDDSVAPSNERPQSYVDMEGRKMGQLDLLLFSSSFNQEDPEDTASNNLD